MTIDSAGSLFALFTFAHFLIDWSSQTEQMALNKHRDYVARAIHCFIYSVLMALLFTWVLGLSVLQAVAVVLILFWTHYLEDTYFLIMMWFRYVRRTEFQRGNALHTILLITIDQIVHLAVILGICLYFS